MSNPEVSEIGNRAEVPRTSRAFLLWLLRRIRAEKKWWLMPMWALLAALALALFLTGNGALVPAIYLAF